MDTTEINGLTIETNVDKTLKSNKSNKIHKKHKIQSPTATTATTTTTTSSVTRSPPKKPAQIMPTSVSECHLLVNHAYTIPQLKVIAKQFLLKTGGSRPELTKRIYDYMYSYKYAIKIQTAFRRLVSRKYMALIRFKETVNDADFLTMEPLKDILKPQFFSFTDLDGFTYGFDAMSFYQLMCTNGIMTNPYNRAEFEPDVVEDFYQLIRFAKFLKVPLNIEIEKDELTPLQAQELRAVGLFQTINTLGNYANSAWFMNLQPPLLMKFLKELVEIWNYRSQLSDAVKRAICYPTGNPFRNIRFNQMYDGDIFIVRSEVMNVIEIMITRGVDRDNQVLGSYYVLCALTLVSYDASIALPWLYQSVSTYY